MGPEKFLPVDLDQKKVLLTDTTMRDAHQSLMATRVRTIDMLRVLGNGFQKAAGLLLYECGAVLPLT